MWEARDFSVLAAGVWALADGCLTKLQPILPSVSAGRVPAASGSHGARPFFITMVVYLSPRARAGCGEWVFYQWSATRRVGGGPERSGGGPPTVGWGGGAQQSRLAGDQTERSELLVEL